MFIVSGVLAHVVNSVEARSHSTRSSAEFGSRSEHVRHNSPTGFISTAYHQARTGTRFALGNMTRRFEDITDSLRSRRHTRERHQHSNRNVLRRLSSHFKRQHGEHAQPMEQRPATQPTTAPPTTEQPTTTPPTAELSAAEPAATALVDDDTAMSVDEVEIFLDKVSVAGQGLRFTPVVDLKTFVFLGESRIGGFTVQTMHRRQYNRQRHLRRLSSCSKRPRGGHNLKSNVVVEANPIDAFAVQAMKRRQHARIRWTVELPERRGYVASPKLIKRWLIPRVILVLVGNDHDRVGAQGADVPPFFATEADEVAGTRAPSNGSVLPDEDALSSNTMGSNVADNFSIELVNRPEHEDAVATSDDGLEVETFEEVVTSDDHLEIETDEAVATSDYGLKAETDEEVATSDYGLEVEANEAAAESVDYLAPDLSDSSLSDTISRSGDSDLTSLVNFLDAVHEEFEGLDEDIAIVTESQEMSDSERDFALATLQKHVCELSEKCHQVMAESPDAFARAADKREQMIAIADDYRRQALVRNAFETWRIRSIALNVKLDNSDVMYQGTLAYQCFRHWRTLAQDRIDSRQDASN